MQPRSPDPSLDELDIRACRQALKQGSRTFHLASLLLPPRVRRPAVALYAFCRLADDAVDHGGGSEAEVADLRQRIQAAHAGSPRSHPVDRALSAAVARHAIPPALLEALIEGLAWDLEGRRYEDLWELNCYAVRVAGTVGAMMALIMGAREPAVVARAVELGIAMQLTNIARDVGEDARSGRLYLPLAWLRDAGIDPDTWLARPRFEPGIGEVVQRLLAEADRLYLRSEAGIAALPAACRPAIRASCRLYAEIGRGLERSGLDSVSRRTVVSDWRKAKVAFASLVGAAPRAGLDAPPLPEARFLVDTVVRAPLPPHTQSAKGSFLSPVRERALWALDLFERLERRDRFLRAPAVDRRA